MPIITRFIETIINAPIQSIFDSISDLTRHPQWSGGNLNIEAVTPGPIAAGKEYLSRGDVGRVQKARGNKVRVTEYAPPHQFAFVSSDPDFGEVTHLFTLAQEGSSVRLRRQMTLTLNPLIAFGFTFLTYPLLGKPSLQRDFARLKARLEG